MLQWVRPILRQARTTTVRMAEGELEAGTGDAVFTVGCFFDVNKGDLDAAAAFRSRLQRGDIDIIGDPQAEAVVV